MTNVDFDFLREKTGHEILPKHMQDDRDYQAMRVITDFLRGRKPDEAVANGRYWLDKVYEQGFAAGRYDAMMRWREKVTQKVTSFFDLPYEREDY